MSSAAIAATPAAPSFNLANNVPGFIKHATDTGPLNPATQINVTLWLKLHNQAQLDQLVSDQRTKGNAKFQHWITQTDFDTQFGPTAQEVKSVQNFVTAHKLTIVETATNNRYVKVQGAVGDIERAFHVQIDTFQFNGQSYRANTGGPSVNDASGAHVDAITGLDDFGFQPKNVRPIGPDGKTPAGTPVAVGSNGTFATGACFRPVETHTFTSAQGSATYTGNRFGADDTAPNASAVGACGYNPAEVQKAYNMAPLYAAGLNGAGETIVITDGFGSGTIQQDANLFSKIYGLPPVDLTIVKAQGLNQSPQNNWTTEVSLDVEWAHAMAPGAKIVLVVSPAVNSLDEAVNLAVVHHYGNTISNSWSSLEGFGNPAQLDSMNRTLEMAAAQGIDVNFSSGDDGDELAAAGFVTVDFPGSSPFATSIGGTSLALNTDGSVKFQSGWGTNLTRIAEPDAVHNTAVIPPLNDPALGLGFQFGAGGGTSLTFAKPDFQASLPGTMRQVPDISMLADPFTGAEVIETIGGTPVAEVIGGTSLAAPLFSGLMAIAAQKAHHGLGQVAPLVYGLTSGVNDIVAVGSPNNVSGVINGSPVSSSVLAAPLDGTTTFYSAFYNSPFSTRWFVITFGTDSSLSTGPGWDNVTGVGAPDGANFVNAIVP